MSSVDERIVKMVFDNGDFAKKVSSTISSLTQLNQTTDQMGKSSGLASLRDVFKDTETTATQAGFHIRDVWLDVATIFEQQVASKIVNVSKQIASAMTIEGVADGFKEYELKMGSIQTIMAGTGESLSTVNKYLEELNTYSDKTIYSFADMTNNIGKFTNAGVGLEDAVLAIKGIANEAAVSGANANEASRAMYNFSQALSAGYVKLIDWKSIENANMATKEFKNTLLEVATSCGTVSKGADGMYQILSENNKGQTMGELVSGTKNFNDSLQYQWMTTEVLTKALKIYATNVEDLSEAEKNRYEEELIGMGFSEEQIKQFEELGTKATKAASEIKTFTMLMDTLKEAIGSGWAMTWQLIIGDFDEAKALWTEVGNALSSIIDQSSKARNELLGSWLNDESKGGLGGRKDLIDGLRNAFKALYDVIKPIGEAMKEVFPPVTAQQFKNLSSGFKEFTEKLKVTEEVTTRVKSIASGFFSVFDIGIKAVKAFASAILPASEGLGNLGWNLFDVVAKIGDFITKVDESITKNQTFEKTFSAIGNVVKPVFDFIISGASGATQILGSLFSKVDGAKGPMSSVGELLKSIFTDIKGGLQNIEERIQKLSPLVDGLMSLFKGLGNIVGSVFKQIGESFSGLSFESGGIAGLVNILNTFMTGGAMYKLFSGTGSLSSIGDILDGFGDALEGFNKKVSSEALMNTAKAIAVLAASLAVVAMIDSDKLLGATAAISTMMITMASAMGVLMAAINSFSTSKVESTFSLFGKKVFGMDATKMIEMSVTLNAVSKALVSMGTAVLMMSVGLKAVADAAEGGHLWDSFAVVSLMLAELTAVAIILGKYAGDSKKGAQGLITMTASLLIMAEALKMVSQVVEGGNALEALGIITIMLGELTSIVLLVQNFGKYNLGSMASLISLTASLNLVVVALKQVSDALGNEGNHIWESLGIISIMLAELAAITVVMGQFGGFAVLGGAGAIAAAAALLIIVQALKQVSDLLGQTDQHVWQALGVIAASLLVLATGLTAMVASLPGAAALTVAAAGLIVLGEALKIIGSLTLAEIGKGLLAVAGSLTILAVGLTAMAAGIPGAAALTLASVGLIALAGALQTFGSMSLGEIVSSLVALFAALAGITLVTSALSVASPLILAFSVALTAFGAALLVAGTGMTVFSAGLTALGAATEVGSAGIKQLATTFIELIPVMVSALMDTLGVLATKIVEYGPNFTEATITIIGIVLDALAASAVKFGETALQIILGILQVLTEKIPDIAKAGTDLMIAYMEAISTEIPRVVDEAYKCAIALINGLADAIEQNNGELIKAVDHLMDAAIQAVTQWVVEFTPLGLLIPDNMKDGIMTNEFSVKDALESIVKSGVEKIKEKVSDFKQAAEDLLGGFIEGLKGTMAGKVISSVVDFGGQIVSALKSKDGLDEHSPSKKTEETGMNFIQGFINGINQNSKDGLDAAKKLGSTLIETLESALEISSSYSQRSYRDGKYLVQGLVEGVKNDTPSAEQIIATLCSKIKTILDKDLAKNNYLVYGQNVCNGIIEGVNKSLSSINTNSTTLCSKIKSVLDKDLAKKNFVIYGQNVCNGIIEGVNKSLSSVNTSITTLCSKIKAVLDKDLAKKNFVIYGQNICNGIIEGINNNLSSVNTTVTNLCTKISSALSSGLSVSKFVSYGKNIGLGLAEGMLSDESIRAVENAARELSEKASEITVNYNGIKSPAKRYIKYGKFIAEGMAEGITDGESDVKSSAEELSYVICDSLDDVQSENTIKADEYFDEDSVNRVKDNLNTIDDEVTTLCNRIIDILGEIDNKARAVEDNILAMCKRIKESFENLVNEAKDGINTLEDAILAPGEQINTVFDELVDEIRSDFDELVKETEDNINAIEDVILNLCDRINDILDDLQDKVTVIEEDIVSSVQSTIDRIKESLESINDMELQPVITPVLDLSNLQSSTDSISALSPYTSLSMADGIQAYTSASSDSTISQLYSQGQNSPVTINMVINAAEGMDEKALAEYVKQELVNEIYNKGAVYA